VAVGGPALLRELQMTEPEVLAEQVGAWKRRGATVLYVVREDRVLGALSLEDAVLPEDKDGASTCAPPGHRS
jgi:P-type Cu2+ transporter